MLRFKCCLQCFKNLCREDVDCAQLWPEICKHACIRHGYISFKLDHSLDHELSILEGMGFIKTHETDKELMVSVQGHVIDAELMHAFCIDIDRHGHYV